MEENRKNILQIYLQAFPSNVVDFQLWSIGVQILFLEFEICEKI